MGILLIIGVFFIVMAFLALSIDVYFFWYSKIVDWISTILFFLGGLLIIYSAFLCVMNLSQEVIYGERDQEERLY